MDPVEINTGAYYLRQLRADDRVDDRPALVAAFADHEMRRWLTTCQIVTLAEADDYIVRRAREWAQDLRCSWAVAEPVTGDLIGEVGLGNLDLTGRAAEAACWVAPDWRGRGVAAQALGAALRFGASVLDLRWVEYLHEPANVASGRVADKCGFVRQGERNGLVVWSRDIDAAGA